ncbi:MAG TPA: ADP-glyceromanno-heptose 6-epimerase [Bacteroidales bacterium]|jgi:ADP-L-glycero-D-manno-heptose 6-epimerase|nr:ADP-glyceromanno-heptose 6-epimerase [Bacteroidales bacterium]
MSLTIVTGAAGFIGSCLVGKLNALGISSIIAVDDFSNPEKNRNLENKTMAGEVHRDDFFTWLEANASDVSMVYHLGARTDTTEFHWEILEKLNLSFTKEMWKACTKYRIPLLYASSAATYGLGEHGYRDDHDVVELLKPLNPYGVSKNEFDKWALKQPASPPFWAGVKFFNVYGPNEYHKGRMASVILHSFRQISETGKVKLFRSHNPGFQDGMQLRDFIYVKDVVDVLVTIMERKPEPGLYNLGTGKARAFLHLAKAVFSALGKQENIEFVDTPADIRDKYQYFTEADMGKMRKNLSMDLKFHSLEDGVQDYVTEYLAKGNYF